MPRLRSARPFGALFDQLNETPGDRQALQNAAQLALQVEFSTIPVYLTGMYSITDNSSDAYQTLRSVVMEEMFHLNQMANIVVALGALPRFTGDAAPVYPGYLPHANENSTPQIGLYRASADVFQNVYAAIETPAPPGAPPQGEQYDSIGQLYQALSDAILAFPGNPFDSPDPQGRQRTDIYLGKFGGKVLRVTDKPTAQAGIEQIVHQGEGSLPPGGQPLDPLQPFGTYNYYGIRTDGTYGPIVGTPLELSHFIKFRRIALEPTAFPNTLPIQSNPDLSQFTNDAALELANAFNQAYSAMLRAFELSFQNVPDDPYFGIVLNMMHQVLPNLALAMMNTPAHQGGDPSVGPNATPTWTYQPGASLQTLEQTLKSCLQHDHNGNLAAALAAVDEAMTGLHQLAVPATLKAL